MSKLLPILIIVVAALVGGGGGFFLKMQSAPSAEASDEHDGEHVADASEDGDDSHGSSKDKKKKSKGGHGESSDKAPTYVKFTRQFVVPVIEDGQPKMLMVFDINIEVDSSFSGSAYSLEPRLRDAILAQLFVFANSGVLLRVTESTEAMATVKAALLETVRKIMGDGAQEILLLDIGVQQY